MTEKTRKTWIVCASNTPGFEQSAYELITAGLEISDGKMENLSCVIIGYEASKYADNFFKRGIKKVYIVQGEIYKNLIEEIYADALAQLILQENPAKILFSASKEIKTIAARLAAKLNMGLISDAIELKNEASGKTSAIKPTFGGELMAKIESRSQVEMITVREGFYLKAQLSNLVSGGEIINFKSDLPQLNAKIKLIESSAKSKDEEEDITQAEIVIAAGRGIKTKEEFEMVKEFAQLMNGAIGITRPLADLGFASESCQIGITGKTIKPKLYIALGISGKTHHTQGILNAKTIIAVNKDINAPIKEISDYFIEADIKEFLPAMIKKLKELKELKETE
ncbi:MAG: electron transfer flavoprotein subunit alpha/FixB family protein [Elusimicrobiales bacterium]|nr:electron transfer flavoprotein subunit alpha/FixB family protein [Elusimicrobiales bacterium]MCK5358732.1 electron transfer flavoprotein subunit alpha/FixB family protein [Elusimicrobiales bacterium]